MTIPEYINTQSPERQSLLLTLHGLILHHDHAVSAEVTLMMGREMIIYKECGHFKYGLSSEKRHLSLALLANLHPSPTP